MTKTRGGRWRQGLSLVAALVCLSGCSPVAPNGWRVEPIAYDNAMDDSRENRIDVTYPMGNITDDTAGGIWTESAGSWLHLDDDGNALRRFNDDDVMTVHGIAALSPTVLAVSRTDREDVSGRGTGLFRYDTDAGTWVGVDVGATTTGDVTVSADGRIVFVDFLGAPVPGAVRGAPGHGAPGLGAPGLGAPVPFAIRAVDASGSLTTVLGEDASLVASAVALDIDSDGTVSVSTERETFTIAADGARVPVSSHPPVLPVLAVSPAGDLLAPGPGTTGGDADWAVGGGSAEARAVLAESRRCPRAVGLVITGGARQAASLPFTCGVHGAAWIDESTFVLSIGGEGGAILATVTRPVS